MARGHDGEAELEDAVKALAVAVAVLVVLACTGCGVNHDAVVQALDRHDLAAARGHLNAGLSTPNAEVPVKRDGWTGLMLAERAVVRAAEKDFAGATQDFAAADTILDVSDMIRNTRTKQLMTPDATHYMYLRGWAQALNISLGLKFYERLLLNPLAALVRMQMGDVNGACVESRRFGVAADWTEHVATNRAASVRAFGELVTALSCGAADQTELACEAYGRSSNLKMIADASSIGAACGNGEKVADGEVWIVVAYGRPSHPETVDAFKSTSHVEIRSGPEASATPGAGATLDGAKIELREVLDVDRAAHDDYDEATTAFTYHVMGQTVKTGAWSPWAWTIVPAHVDVAVARVAPGEHTLVIRARDVTDTRKIVVRADAPTVTLTVVPW